MSSVDWNAVRKVAEEGGAAPEGIYNLIVEEATAHSSGKGFPGLKLKLKIEDGPYKDTVIFHYVLLMLEYPKSVPGFLADLGTLGVPDTMLVGGKEFDEIAAYVNQQPRRVRAEIVQDEYQGSKNNKVKKYGRLMTATGTANGSFSIAPPPTTPAAPAPFIAPPAVPATPPPF